MARSQRPLTDRVIVRFISRKRGRGVFAVRMLRARQKIGVIMGEVHSAADWSSNYCIDLEAGDVLEPAAPFRFLNHSCEPNAEMFRSGDGGKAVVSLYAIRTIRQGEELTIDYGWAADAAIPCLCGVPTCRGWVVAKNQQDLLAPMPSETA